MKNWLYSLITATGFSWVSWVLKNFELDLAGLAAFGKINLDFS